MIDPKTVASENPIPGGRVAWLLPEPMIKGSLSTNFHSCVGKTQCTPGHDSIPVLDQTHGPIWVCRRWVGIQTVGVRCALRRMGLMFSDAALL
jgi:hypothetical protein